MPPALPRLVRTPARRAARAAFALVAAALLLAMGARQSHRANINYLDPARDLEEDESQGSSRREPSERAASPRGTRDCSVVRSEAPERSASGGGVPAESCSRERSKRKQAFPYTTSSTVETTSSGGRAGKRERCGPRLAPLDPNKLLLFIGQDIDSVADYADNIDGGADVSGVTTYTALSDEPGASLLGVSPEIAKCPIGYGAGVVDASELLRRHPYAALNVGLDITKAKLSGIVRGAHDGNLRKLGAFIKDLAPRPVYLRIGYECDGPWNAYNPKTFPGTFAYIVEFLRRCRVDNFASVWQVSASRHSTADIRKYWPGAHVVDWVGCSYFEFYPAGWKALVSVARANNRPILICEAAPQGYNIPRGRHACVIGKGSDSRRVGVDAVWNAWFRPFFRLVYENRDVIRGVSYINCNWESQSMWNHGDQGYWGNTVVTSTKAPKVKRRWEAEVNNRDIWLRATPDFWTRHLSA